MNFKALKSFSGVISMSLGEIKEIGDEKIAEDLLKAGYIEKSEKKPMQKAKTKTKSKK